MDKIHNCRLILIFCTRRLLPLSLLIKGASFHGKLQLVRAQRTVERPTLNGRSTTQSLRQGAGTRHQGDILITPVCLFNLYWPPAQKVSLISKTSILWSRNIAHLNTSVLVNQVTDMRSTHQTHIDVHLHF